MRHHRKRRFGYTLAEVLIVISIIGIITAISVPKFAAAKNQAQLTGAMTRFSRGIMAARQAAIQRGKVAYFKHSNNKFWVIVDTTGNLTDSIVITAPYNISTEYGVAITSPGGVTSIQYDPRGVATQPTKRVFAFKHSVSNTVDSLCVSRLGNTVRQVCP
jgi:prepilin-type N-terminal cleavage/methylation domain-containing protein